MKSLFYKCICLILVALVILSPETASCEGTRQLEPKPGDVKSSCKLMLSKSIYNHRIPFALVDCPEVHRLNIRISDCNSEKIYLGFGTAINYYDTVQVYGNIYYQVKDPDGNIVTGNSLRLIPSQPGDSGYISNRSQANAGPNINNSNPAGYKPLVITPHLNGDYYIEFSFDCEEFQFKFFDITIASNNTFIPGRIWSKSWQLSTGSTNSSEKHSDALLYIYTNDSIVSRFDCNQLTGGVWTVYSNEWGCSIYGSWKHRRKSMKGNASLVPQHMIFLNDPDITVFPSGVIGEMLDAEIIKPCDTVVQFGITVSKRGYVTMIIDLPPQNETESGPEDIEETYLVNTGYTVLNPPWDGRNALGEGILNGIPVEVTLIFINGLTNIPLYDVEENPSGFKVDNIRPNVSTGETKLRLFWDDSLLPYGSADPSNIIDGCLYTGTTPLSGCHNWVFEDLSMGDNNTVNTWWYLPGQDSIVLTFPLALKTRMGSISGPSALCRDQTGLFKTSVIFNATQYIWEIEGHGFTYSAVTDAPDSSFSWYVPVDLVEGYYLITVRGRNPECGDGASASYAVYVFGESSPPIISSSVSCTNTTTAFSIPGFYTNIKWTVNKGEIVGPDNVNPVTVKWQTACTDSISVVATSADCGTRSSKMGINVLEPPEVLFSPEAYSKSCPGLPVVFNDNSTLPYGDIVTRRWDWGDGNIDNLSAPRASHAYSDTGEYHISLEVLADYGCKDNYSVEVNIIPYPVADFSYYSNCLEQPIQLTDISIGQDLSGWTWDFHDSPATIENEDTKQPFAVFHSVGNYPVTLTVKNLYGCENSTARIIQIHSLPDAGYQYTVACQGFGNLFSDNSSTADAPVGYYDWQLYKNGILSGTYHGDPVFIYLPDSTDYQLKLIITDTLGCVDSITEYIDARPIPNSNFSFIENHNNEPGLLLFENTTPDAVSYKWFFGENDSSTLANPTVKLDTEGKYKLLLISMNEYGCIDSLLRWYYYLPGYFIPNAFTPNNDGLNDIFYPVTKRNVLQPFSMIIFDRWGEMVFSSNDPSVGWDGKKQGKMCIPGIYSYIITYAEGSLEGMKAINKTGFVTLIR